MKFWILFLALSTSLFAHDGIEIERNIPEDHTGPKIAIVTAIIGKEYANIVRFGTKTKRDYCQRHGYDFIIGRKELKSCEGIISKRDRGMPWTKIPLVKTFLKEYDYIFWSDADSMIMNDERKLEEYIHDDADLVIAYMRRAPIKINSGEFLIKNTLWSHDFLLQVWREGQVKQFVGYEQQVMHHILERDNLWNHCHLAEEYDLNNHPKWYHEGDFIVHFYNIHGKQLRMYFNLFERVKKGETPPPFHRIRR